ncbi:MAG TPA: glycosyltransferase family 4 protein [Kineosporiaceae bacterium]|nr:glycosyltransferase family 4 protein [Kineosporiaceae bacterium]
MRILAWHVHGSWMTAFVHSRHEVLVPVTPDRGPDGLGRATTYAWPAGVREVTPEQVADEGFDVVVLQRPRDLELVEAWTGRRPGVDVPAVYVEHNTPRGDVAEWRHLLADRSDIPVVHVTPFNAAMWDNGDAPVRVVEHGIPDPGALYSGSLESLAFTCNEPVRRTRVAGTDLAARIARSVPVHVYGMKTEGVEQVVTTGLAGAEELAQADLHKRMAEHRAYLHPYRWTSLGLALLEAMTMGMPVLVLAATAAPEAVPPGAGLVTADVDALAAHARALVADPGLARAQGEAARAHALERFGLERFLSDWDRLLEEVAR